MHSHRTRWTVILLIFVLAVAIMASIYKQFKQTTPLDGLNPGQAAPNFVLQNLQGNDVSLQEFKGKVVLINIWASWCKPCRDEIPGIVQTYQAYKNQGFVVLGVNYKENPVTVKGFMEQFHMNYPVVFDTDGKMSEMYKVGPLPTSFLVNRKGIIEKVIVGQMSESYLKQAIGNMVKEK
ncbi:redoxin domain-containing protein [Fodinisporobacter ferrooxydans]|uniref:Redoxin domain-containing protein n=1 Tax=Fodinisporobacter ferrooxydans TaxID=2901836 RepID=A0ABY4CNR9_9BACL|nr:redoxin domain-containing protein [Alicyclobacillaceae bacterium MYW30-H2]